MIFLLLYLQIFPVNIQLSLSMTLSDLDPDFKVDVFFEIKYLKNGARLSHSYYWSLIGSNMRSIEWYHDLE